MLNRSSEIDAITPKAKPTQPKLHPAFNVDPALVEQLRRKPSSNLPAHLRSPTDEAPNDNGTGDQPPMVSPMPQFPQYQDSYVGHDGLPRLNFDQIIKRVRVHFNGHGDNIVFYNQLNNALAPYGCYLKPIQDLRLNESVCPDTYDGVEIGPSRKTQMSSCIYQLLQHPETVPLDFTAVRNIINRFSKSNDGYAVLYSIMEPILHEDDIFEVPNMQDCADIHEYAQRLNSYFDFEELHKRYFTPHIKTNMFLNGLDSRYTKQVQRAQQLFDNRKITDTSVPDILHIDRIPETIDKWYTGKNGPSVIRAMFQRNSGNTRDASKSNKVQNHTDHNFTKPSGDKPCGICHITGHHKSECSGFAKYVLFKDADKAMDDIGRSKIVEKYKAYIKQKAEARSKFKTLGNVRHMWESGSTFADIEKGLVQLVTPNLAFDPCGSSDEEDSQE